jgi:tetratricopeptide (TPR) repeat protein/transglutaminase-like putative cysteine protease
VSSSVTNVSIRRFGVSLFLVAWLGCGAVLFGQSSRPAVSPPSAVSHPSAQQAKGIGAAAAAATDYSSEAFIIEKLVTKTAFAEDGSSTIDAQVTEKIQSQAGVQNVSVLSFPYASVEAKLEIVYLRVRKADGTVVETPADSVQDMPAEITREAPLYSDIREKQVAARGLEPGDTLEYEYRIEQKPLTQGEFWYSYDFVQKGIALSEELQLSVPEDRQVIVGSGVLKPVVTVESGQRIYTWRTSRLHHGTQDATERIRESLDAPPADVQMTSFRNWGEVGEWFGKLAAPRAAPTPAIRAEEEALTRGMTTDAEKLRAIYNYVSLKFRYVGVDFGIGRYQPHAADVVLSNAYGDCKDKETLLAALLGAAGLKTYPALINSVHKIDPAVPSPGQFDHVIAAVPQGAGYLWLDSTPAVAPEGYLLGNLRDKEALVIPDAGSPQLVKTPASPPFKGSETFTVDAKFDPAGRLDADMKVSFRDDSEILLRLGLRATPEARWKDLLQAISYRWGFGGTVSNATFSTVDSTDPTLQMSYHYTRKDYPSWTDGKILLPVPQFFLPAAKDDKDKTKAEPKPVKLGPPGEMDYKAKVTLPAGYTPVPPAAVNLVDDFAEYHSHYTFANGVFEGERELIVKAPKVAAGQMAAYKKFADAVSNDGMTYIPLKAKAGTSSAASIPEQAETLYEQGRQAWSQRDLASAADDFQKAIAADGKFALAWSSLGEIHVGQGDVDEGLEEMKKAIAVDPAQVSSYKMLAYTQSMLRRPEEALATWRSLEKADPNDRDAPENIAAILLGKRHYAEALPELELAVKRDSTNARLFFALGETEIHLDQGEKGFVAFEQGLRLDPSPLSLNQVAYDLAVANLHLDAALDYAQKMVSQEEQKTANLSLGSLSHTDLGNMEALAYFWDTLGWVDFRLGHDDEAEKYLRAAWQLSQSPDVANHLGWLYQKEGRKHEAGEYYALALSVPQSVAYSRLARSMGRTTQAEAKQGIRRRLVALLGSGSRADRAVLRARDDLTNQRSVRLAKVTSKSVMAEFFVLLAAGPKVTDVKFISGPPELRAAMKDLSLARFDESFPDAGPEKIVRRGVLDCEPAVPYCQFILMTPDLVRSVH